MGAVLSIDKPVLLLDVYNNEIKDMKGVKDKILKQRIISVEKFKEAKKVGIIVGIKQGQKFGSQKILVDKFEKLGKKVIIITMSELTPDKLMNFYDIDGFVELACPRIAVDDFSKYNKPIITFKEALIALGEKSWEEIIKEGLI
jgi:2-(3-amino-3-carboxypropyl)histidine synthase